MTRVRPSQRGWFDKGAPHNCRPDLDGDDTFLGHTKSTHTHTYTKKEERNFDSLLYTKQEEAGVPCATCSHAVHTQALLHIAAMTGFCPGQQKTFR